MMEILIAHQSDIWKWLPMQGCIDLMREALSMLARGKGINPLRSIMWLPDKSGLLGIMPAYLENRQVMGLKSISIFPGNHGMEFDSHQGGVLLFETKNGRLLALLEAGAITAIRTAAVSGVATQLLAKKDAGRLAILGSGVQAKTHLQAMLFSRKISTVRVWSRDFNHACRFVESESKQSGVKIETKKTVEEAVSDADIICTVTAATEPILKGDWLAPGCHINAVGSSTPLARELDTCAVVKSRLFVDRRESTLNEAGDYLIPLSEGKIDASHIQAEIGDVLLKQKKGRTSDKEITLFKSLGLAVEDLAAAHFVYQRMLENNAGTRVEFY